MLELSLIHLHLLAWLIVGASVGLFALAGTAIDRLRPIRQSVRHDNHRQQPRHS
ncbi:MAG: hypothetical protein K1V76_03000 [Candidatus Amulumruptor sp.]